jgi:hypothetical protein
MKFNQMERAVVVACAGVFLLATANGMEMTSVCPAGATDNCSRGTATDGQLAGAMATGVSGLPSKAQGHVGKITSRLDVPAEHAEAAKQPVGAP